MRAGLIRDLLVGRSKNQVEAKGVQIRGVRIAGRLDFHSALLTRPLALRDCYLEHAPVFTRAATQAIELTGSHMPGLHAAELVAARSVSLDDGFTATGEINLAGASISGQLVCVGANFRNEGGYALMGDGLTTKSSVYLSQNFVAIGEVRLVGADLGGQLDCTRGAFSNEGGNALTADGLTVSGDVFIDGTNAIGLVRFIGAEIAGRFSWAEGTLRNKGRLALAADGITTRGSVLLGQGFRATGEVRLARAVIGGQLSCAGGLFHNPRGYALTATRLTVKGDLFLNNGFKATGQVRLIRAEISGQFDCDGGTFANEGADALNAEGMKVEQAFFWRGVTLSPGSRLNIAHAEVGTLVDDMPSWPKAGHLILTGFIYDRLAGRSPRDVKDRIAWLDRQPVEYVPQPYEQLAKVYRATGEERFAKRIAIAKEEARRTKGGLSRPAKSWSWFLKYTVNYGYEPWRAIWLMLALVVGGFVLFASNPAVLVPTRAGLAISGASQCTADYPCLQPLMYSADVVLPIIDLRQQEFWIPDASKPWGWAYLAYFWLSIIAGWAIATALVAGITGVVRRE